MNQQVQIIDGDGHIFEDGDGIARHFPFSAAGARLRSGVFPLNSHIQYSLTRTPPGAFATTPDGRFKNPGPEGWIEMVCSKATDPSIPQSMVDCISLEYLYVEFPRPEGGKV